MSFNLFAFLKKIGFLEILLLIGYLINPFKFGFIFGYPIILLLLLKQDFIKKSLDNNFFILLLFSGTYALFYGLDPIQGTQYFFIYLIFPPLFYLYGKYICSKAENEKELFIILIALGGIYSFSGLLSVLQNIMSGGLGQINRSIPMFWAPNSAGIGATIMGAFFTLNMCIPALLVKRPPKSRILLISSIILFLLSLLCILRLGTRTQIGILIITLFVSLAYVVPKQSLKKNVMLFLIFAIGIALILQNISFDLKSDWLLAFADRMGDGANSNLSSGGGRTDRWVKSIEYMFTKPLGWKLEEFGHSHNLWLDTLRVAGIFPFIFLVIFSVKTFFKIKQASALNKSHVFFSNQIRIYALGFFLMFMVEPILEGMFPLFVVFCTFTGVVNQYCVMQLKNA